MDKNEVLKILETAKDENGEVPMRLVRQAFEELPEPCEDTISRQAAIETLEQYLLEKVVNCLSILEELQSAQPKRKKGEWVGCDSDWLKTMCKCSECGAMIDINEKYRNFFCYHCGARMAERRGE